VTFKASHNESAAPSDLAGFIRSESFPCVGAKSSLALGHLRVFEAGAIASSKHDLELRAKIIKFGREVAGAAPGMDSFACLFSAGAEMSEAVFEAAIWNRLQALHELDALHGSPWPEHVSRDPASPKFSMSVGGCPFFVVGLHPGAERPARRFARPAIIFNPHDQFEQLRADGRYANLQRIVRERELNFTGSINPMLADFGDRGEAVQYSGRRVGPNWRCPFKVLT